MNFNEALELLKKGKKVKQTGWDYNENAYIVMSHVYGIPTALIYKGAPLSRHSEVYRFSFLDTQLDLWKEVL